MESLIVVYLQALPTTQRKYTQFRNTLRYHTLNY
jgi:hypothetical protein